MSDFLNEVPQMQTAMERLKDPAARMQFAQSLAQRFPAPPVSMFPSTVGTGKTTLDENGVARAQLQNTPQIIQPVTPALRETPTVDLPTAMQFAQFLQAAPGRPASQNGMSGQVTNPAQTTPGSTWQVPANPTPSSPPVASPTPPVAQTPVTSTPVQPTPVPPTVITPTPPPVTNTPVTPPPSPVTPPVTPPTTPNPPPVVPNPPPVNPNPTPVTPPATVGNAVTTPPVGQLGTSGGQGASSTNQALSFAHNAALDSLTGTDNPLQQGPLGGLLAAPFRGLFDGLIGEGGNLAKESRTYVTENGVVYDQNGKVITRVEIPSSGMVQVPGLNRNGNPIFVDSAGNILKKQQSGGGFDNMGVNIRQAGRTPLEINGVTAQWNAYTPQEATEADRTFGGTTTQVGGNAGQVGNVQQPGAFNPENPGNVLGGTSGGSSGGSSAGVSAGAPAGLVKLDGIRTSQGLMDVYFNPGTKKIVNDKGVIVTSTGVGQLGGLLHGKDNTVSLQADGSLMSVGNKGQNLITKLPGFETPAAAPASVAPPKAPTITPPPAPAVAPVAQSVPQQLDLFKPPAGVTPLPQVVNDIPKAAPVASPVAPPVAPPVKQVAPPPPVAAPAPVNPRAQLENPRAPVQQTAAAPVVQNVPVGAPPVNSTVPQVNPKTSTILDPSAGVSQVPAGLTPQLLDQLAAMGIVPGQKPKFNINLGL